MASPLQTWYSSQPTAASRFDDASELSWFHSEQPHFPHSPEFKTDVGTVNMLGSEWEKGLLKFEDPMDAKDDSFFTATAVQKHEVSFPDPLTTKTLDDDYSLLPATSNDLTEILFGQTNEISDYSLTLKDDRFRIANMESEVTLYPNMGGSSSVIPVIPPENADTYLWRGDMGILDRLAYTSNAQDVPTNWEMMTLDVNNMAKKLQVSETPLLEGTAITRRISEQAHVDMKVPKQDNGGAKQENEESNTEISAPPPMKKKRIRKDKYKRVKGPNPYGRKGVVKCMLCRDNGWKCVYTTEDQACDVCRARNRAHCIKLAPSGRKFQTHESFEEITEAVDSPLNITSNDSDQMFPLLCEFRKLVEKPGLFSLHRMSLPLAIRAWRSRHLDPETYIREVEDDIYNAYAALEDIRKYRYCRAPITHESVFACHLMGWVAYSTCSQELFAHVHFEESLACLTFLSLRSAQYRSETLHSILLCYGPFILDCANAWTVRNGVLPIRTTTFNQRVVYFDGLGGNDTTGSWHTGILEAANSTLGNLMEISLTTLHNLATQATKLDFSRQGVDQALQYIRAELGDPDLHAALEAIYKSFQGVRTDHSNVEGQLITRLYHRLRCILLIHGILESPSLEDGMALPNTGYIARAVINFCRRQAIRRDGPIKDYYLISWHNYAHLLLGGMALQAYEHPESADWVISELEFIGKQEAAEYLQRYWREKDIFDLLQVIKFARFPEPMKPE